MRSGWREYKKKSGYEDGRKDKSYKNWDWGKEKYVLRGENINFYVPIPTTSILEKNIELCSSSVRRHLKHAVHDEVHFVKSSFWTPS